MFMFFSSSSSFSRLDINFLSEVTEKKVMKCLTLSYVIIAPGCRYRKLQIFIPKFNTGTDNLLGERNEIK